MTCVIALDVGGTAMKGALLSPGGAPLHRERWPTRRDEGPGAVVEAIASAALELRERARALGVEALAAGVAVPGQVDEATGTAVYSANLGWRELPLRDRLADALSLPVAFAQDVRAGAIAEGRIGAARDAADFLFVAIGTGIGAAVVLDGRARTGVHGLAGELGHVRAGARGERCACGGDGCAEAVASAPAIARRYLRSTDPAAAPVDSEEVLRRAVAGDPAARHAWDDAIVALAGPLAAAVALLDVGVVVLGGGVARAGVRLLEPLERELAARLPVHPAPSLRAAALGDEAGSIGAGLLAWDLAAGQPGARP